MTTYAWPAALAPRSVELTLVPNVRRFQSPYTQSAQTVDLLGERWRMTIGLSERRQAAGAAREAFFAKLRGGVHWVTLHHFARPVPRGTLRGTPTLASAASQGAQSLVLNVGAGATLKAGDMLGLAGMLLMVADDCAESGGTITVPLSTRLRAAAAQGAAVVWDQPSATFELQAAVPISYRPGATDAVQAEFMEIWA